MTEISHRDTYVLLMLGINYQNITVCHNKSQHVTNMAASHLCLDYNDGILENNKLLKKLPTHWPFSCISASPLPPPKPNTSFRTSLTITLHAKKFIPYTIYIPLYILYIHTTVHTIHHNLHFMHHNNVHVPMAPS